MFAKSVVVLLASLAATAQASAISKRDFAGDGTWYNVGLGACGISNTDAELVVAASDKLYGTYPGATANPNLNPICGKKMSVSYQGKSVIATVVDRCGGCQFYDVDLSPTAFQQLAPLETGRIKVTWKWL